MELTHRRRRKKRHQNIEWHILVVRSYYLKQCLAWYRKCDGIHWPKRRERDARIRMVLVPNNGTKDNQFLFSSPLNRKGNWIHILWCFYFLFSTLHLFCLWFVSHGFFFFFGINFEFIPCEIRVTFTFCIWTKRNKMSRQIFTVFWVFETSCARHLHWNTFCLQCHRLTFHLNVSQSSKQT